MSSRRSSRSTGISTRSRCLAEGHALADGGRRCTITLRKGVRFHNGKELTAIDVVASLNRWGAARGRTGRPWLKSLENPGFERRGHEPIGPGQAQPDRIDLANPRRVVFPGVLQAREEVGVLSRLLSSGGTAQRRPRAAVPPK